MGWKVLATRRIVAAVVTAMVAAWGAGPRRAGAEEVVKVGVILSLSGAFADSSEQIQNGLRLYMKEHGDTVAGTRVEVLMRDDGGDAAAARRLAQDLVLREKVDVLTGFLLTPSALAAAPVATQSKTPMILMNAQGTAITRRSPYLVRVSETVGQATGPLGLWAARHGIENAYILVSDYAPGHDSETSFTKAFTEAGGKIIGAVHVAPDAVDFAPYVQKIVDYHPQAIFVFVTKGEGLLKAFVDVGVARAGIKVIGSGEMTDDRMLERMGDPAIGLITAHHYSFAHDSPLNRTFTADYVATYGADSRPGFLAVGGYDGMAAIYTVIEKLGGKFDRAKAMEILSHLHLDSPRGPIDIDPETRDVVQDIYLRRVERRDGQLVNAEFDKIPHVKDMLAAQAGN